MQRLANKALLKAEELRHVGSAAYSNRGNFFVLLFWPTQRHPTANGVMGLQEL